MNSFVKSKTVPHDIRALDASDVCSMGEWLTRYMHLEDSPVTDAKRSLHFLVRTMQEFESDFGVFGISDE